MKKVKLTPVSIFHYFRLVYRSILFLWMLVLYILYRVRDGGPITDRIESRPFIVSLTCAVFVFEMILRFFRPNMRALAVRSSLLAITKKPAVLIF